MSVGGRGLSPLETKALGQERDSRGFLSGCGFMPRSPCDRGLRVPQEGAAIRRCCPPHQQQGLAVMLRHAASPHIRWGMGRTAAVVCVLVR